MFCLQPGCSTIVARGRCRLHDRRPNAAIRKLYHTKRWERLRLRVLVEQDYACASCDDVVLDLEVDHIRKHDGDLQLFWDRANLQALCGPCHARKTRGGS